MHKKNKFIKIFTVLLIIIFLLTSFGTAIVMFGPGRKSLDKHSNTPKIDINSLLTGEVETKNDKLINSNTVSGSYLSGDNK